MDIKKYVCNICNKPYKSAQSYSNHKNRFHLINKNAPSENQQNIHQIQTLLPPSTNIVPTKSTLKKTEQTICEFCNKNFSCYNSMNRHIQKCKNKKGLQQDNIKLQQKNDELTKEIIEIKKSFDEMKTMMLNIMNEKYKMHPKKLKKIINNNINNNNNNNNNNLIINNNQINIIELGNEKLDEIFTKEEKLKILKKGYSSLEEIIRYTHLNKNFSQFQNIIITNKRNNEAYMYNKILKKFILVDKTELLDNLIDYRIDDLTFFYNEHKNKLEPKLRTNLENMFKLKEESDEYGKRKRGEFNILLYNECNKGLLKLTNEQQDNKSI